MNDCVELAVFHALVLDGRDILLGVRRHLDYYVAGALVLELDLLGFLLHDFHYFLSWHMFTWPFLQHQHHRSEFGVGRQEYSRANVP